MYVVTEKEGLLWQPDANSQGKCTKSGWDELTLELREKTLISRTSILCEPQPNWFGNDYAPRTKAAQYSAWNVLIEFQRLELLLNGYYVFVSPSLNRGFKFEIIGWKDVVKIFIADNGSIAWRVYREIKEGETPEVSNPFGNEVTLSEEEYGQEEPLVKQPYLDKCRRIASGMLEASLPEMHPNVGKQLREELKQVLKPYENNKPATT